MSAVRPIRLAGCGGQEGLVVLDAALALLLLEQGIQKGERTFMAFIQLRLPL